MGLFRKRIWMFICVAAAVGAVIFLLSVLLSPRPPIEELTRAQSAARAAQQARAEEYAPGELFLANGHLQDVHREFLAQNRKLPLVRNYDAARSLIQLAMKEAEFAQNRSLWVQDSLKSESMKWMKLTGERLENYRSQFQRLPLGSSMQRKAVQGEILLRESTAALDRGDYFQAAGKARLAASALDQANSNSSDIMNGHLANKDQWRQWVDETVAWSAKHNNYVIIVDKMAHACYLYYDGRRKNEFAAEFGPSWIGDKSRKGDQATPEGRYRVTKKKSVGQTQYYKSLEIDYPNDDDVIRFRKAKQTGQLPQDAQIGGLIQIHGYGGKGVDWTNGCVALKNADMDQLFPLISVGTPVTIVLMVPDDQ